MNFSNVASVRYNRSKQDLSNGVKTTMSVGKLYPIKVQEVLPGDTFKCDFTAVSRCTSAFLKPIIDNLYMDVHHFFVPLRLVYDKAEEVFGVAKPSAYTENELAEIPRLGVSLVSPGTVGDYLGLPVQVNDTTMKYTRSGCSILPFRAFAKIYNDWFRNENTVDEVYLHTGDLSSSEELNNQPWSPNNYTGQLPYVSKKKDYFTSCLPNTQKGLEVSVGSAALPVKTAATSAYKLGDPVYSMTWGNYLTPNQNFTSTPYAPRFLGVGGMTFGDGTINNIKVTRGYEIGKVTSTSPYFNADYFYPDNNQVGDKVVNDGNILVPNNLWAQGEIIDINTLRTAFQLQKMLEKDARYGSRYNEYLLGHFGVTSPDARLQFSEYLGGGRIPIQIQQVSQTSASTNDSALGLVGANSQSLGHSKFSKGFVEHGFVVTVACIKQLHTYQQGIPRLFFRRKREDFYDPCLANISEQPVYTSQLFGYAEDENDPDDITYLPFGYNEAWADYRYEPSMVTGQARSGVQNSLDIWHLADYYEEEPVLSQEFTDENSANIDRVLAVPTTSQDNFLLDAWFNVSAIRVMPVYSVPGLVDHH